MITIIELIFNFCNFNNVIIELIFNFCNNVFLTRLLTLGILFSAVFNAVFVAKPITSGILPSISAILAL